MIRRRFVNIVAENYKSGTYSLHRIDVSKHLFSIGPRPGFKEEDLHVIHGVPGQDKNPCFDVLRFGCYDEPRMLPTEIDCWYCQSLPLPPFVYNPRYKPALISSYTVVEGGRTICLSSDAEGIGTYCFDTVRCEWRQAGEWVMPFDGAVEYVPDLGIWLGFSAGSPHHLCATSDLRMLQHAWQDLSTPKEWMATKMKLLNLGSGRFCIAKVFKVEPNTGKSRDEFAVLTGLEIFTNGGDDNNLQGLQMVKHKSIRHICAVNSIPWVL